MPNQSKRTSATASQSADESEFDVVLATVIERLQADGQAKLDDCVREFPQYEERLRRLVPCMQVLAAFGNSSAAGADELPLSLGNNTSETNPDTPSLGRELGDFRLLDEIGRGGMGIVYEAEQLCLSRRVALKVLPFAGMLDSRQIARFKNEARAAASLDHPHIVSVISVGSQRGVHYYAMQYIEGQTLAQVIAKQQGDDADPQADEKRPAESDTVPVAVLSTQRDANPSERFRTIADLGIQAAQALAYSHEMGIVHRDIKPSNLLLDDDGKLSITDFGLAQIEGTGNLTMTGDLVGTLRYMSPEQAAGEKLLDGRTDVYSLGITLYELLTLRPAFEGTEKAKLLRNILERDPPTPRSKNSSIPRDLETIVLKATAKEPYSRYGNAEELAGDLRRFLEHRPILARRARPHEQILNWTKRNHVVAILTAVIASLLILLAIGASIVAVRRANLALAFRELQAQADQAQASSIVIHDSDWALTRVIPFAGGFSASFNPKDGLLYVVRLRDGIQGLYRINADNTAFLIAKADRPSALVIDPDDGDLFVSEGVRGHIYRTAFGATGRQLWVSGFHAGDDDPIGMAIATNDYSGDVIAPGQALVVDRGYVGADEIWQFSPDEAEGEQVVHDDDKTLINPIDITISSDKVFLVDTGEEKPGNGGAAPGTIYELGVGGSLTPLATSEVLLGPMAIAAAPASNDLYVLEVLDERLVKVDSITGEVQQLFSGFSGAGSVLVGVDVSVDGNQIVVTGRKEVYVFMRITQP